MSSPRAYSTPVESLLAGVDEAGRARLDAASQTREVGEGEVVVEYGANVDHVFFVRKGLLRTELPDRHGLPVEVARLAPGDLFGEMSFLRSERAAATVRAVTAVTLTVVPHAVLGDLAERYPEVMRQLASLIANRLSETNERFRQLRPGRAVACMTSGGEAVEGLLYQVALSASKHLRRPVLVLDLSGALRRGARLSPLSPESGGDDYTSHRQFAAQSTPGVGLIDASEQPELQPLLNALSQLQAIYPLVLVHVRDNGPLASRVIDALDGPLVVAEDDAAETIEHSDRAGFLDVRLGEVATGAGLVRPSFRRVPGSKAALEGEGPEWSGGREPWASVEWIARHLIRRRVGLALGAGGSKGYAHLGVIARLQELNVPFDYIAGTSIGAPIAAALAAGVPIDEISELIDRTFARALRPTIPIHSFLSSRTLRTELEKIAKGRRFEQLPIPLSIVTVDLIERTEVVLSRGSLARAMVASMAIPGIFPPVRVGSRQLVDGALLNPIPNATVAAMGADIVLRETPWASATSAWVQPSSRRLTSSSRPYSLSLALGWDIEGPPLVWFVATQTNGWSLSQSSYCLS